MEEIEESTGASPGPTKALASAERPSVRLFGDEAAAPDGLAVPLGEGRREGLHVLAGDRPHRSDEVDHRHADRLFSPRPGKAAPCEVRALGLAVTDRHSG